VAEIITMAPGSACTTPELRAAAELRFGPLAVVRQDRGLCRSGFCTSSSSACLAGCSSWAAGRRLLCPTGHRGLRRPWHRGVRPPLRRGAPARRGGVPARLWARRPVHPGPGHPGTREQPRRTGAQRLGSRGRPGAWDVWYPGGEVTSMIDAWRAGQMTLADLAWQFLARSWPAVLPACPPGLEETRAAVDDLEPYVIGSFDNVVLPTTWASSLTPTPASRGRPARFAPRDGPRASPARPCSALPSLADQRGRRPRRDCGSSPPAMRPWTPGSWALEIHGRGTDGGGGSGYADRLPGFHAAGLPLQAAFLPGRCRGRSRPCPPVTPRQPGRSSPILSSARAGRCRGA
jgi:hypothetical protein